jgi:hypothetical protein
VKHLSLSTIISIISLIIAFAAFVTSWRVQRSSYKLQLRLAEQMGRLQSVEKLYVDQVKKLGFGFRVHNGSTEVTVTQAMLRIRYTVMREKAIILGKIRWGVDYEIEADSDDFGALGIAGPSLRLRLDRFDEREWRFPYLSSFDVPQYHRRRNVPEQYISFTLSVTASGNSVTSAPFTPWRSSDSPFSHSFSHGYGWSLEELLLGLLANKAVRNIESASQGLKVPPELERMMVNTADLPAEFLRWLTDSWEKAGSFRDESTEKVARMLARLGSSRPDPELLSAVTLEISGDQPPSDLDV